MFFLLGTLFALGHSDVQLCHRRIVSNQFYFFKQLESLWAVQIPQIHTSFMFGEFMLHLEVCGSLSKSVALQVLSVCS